MISKPVRLDQFTQIVQKKKRKEKKKSHLFLLACRHGDRLEISVFQLSSSTTTNEVIRTLFVVFTALKQDNKSTKKITKAAFNFKTF